VTIIWAPQSWTWCERHIREPSGLQLGSLGKRREPLQRGPGQWLKSFDCWHGQRKPHARWVQVSPIYTTQPVVKPVVQLVVSCIQTFNRLSKPFHNHFDNRLYHVYNQLSNRLYNLVWQPVERTVAIRSARLSNQLYNRFDNRFYRVNGALVFIQWNSEVCQCRDKSATQSQKRDKWASRENCVFFRDTSLKIGTVPENLG